MGVDNCLKVNGTLYSGVQNTPSDTPPLVGLGGNVEGCIAYSTDQSNQRSFGFRVKPGLGFNTNGANDLPSKNTYWAQRYQFSLSNDADNSVFQLGASYAHVWVQQKLFGGYIDARFGIIPVEDNLSYNHNTSFNGRTGFDHPAFDGPVTNVDAYWGQGAFPLRGQFNFVYQNLTLSGSVGSSGVKIADPRNLTFLGAAYYGVNDNYTLGGYTSYTQAQLEDATDKNQDPQRGVNPLGERSSGYVGGGVINQYSGENVQFDLDAAFYNTNLYRPSDAGEYLALKRFQWGAIGSFSKELRPNIDLMLGAAVWVYNERERINPDANWSESQYANFTLSAGVPINLNKKQITPFHPPRPITITPEINFGFDNNGGEKPITLRLRGDF